MDLSFSGAAAIFKNNTRSVLLVTSQLRARELKIAYAMKSLGWFVGLIYCDTTPFVPEGYFDCSWKVASFKEAHKLAAQLSPPIVHVFSGAIDKLVLLFCRKKIAPVVIDLNDVFSPALFNYCHERFKPTRKVLSLADAYCARDLQVKCAEQVDKFQIPSQVILFPEYCWNKTPHHIKPKFGTHEIHVVSIGTISLETKGMYDGGVLELARLFLEQKIHFHIYPHWSYRKTNREDPNINFERDFADFLKLERKSPYLHVHESLPAEKLPEVLPQYDFGVVTGGYAGFNQVLKYYKPTYLNACYAGRIADFLDAHLPVLINEEIGFNNWLLKRYGVSIDLKGITRPGFKSTLQALKEDKKMLGSMSDAVKKMSITGNASRLENFYLKIQNIAKDRENMHATSFFQQASARLASGLESMKNLFYMN